MIRHLSVGLCVLMACGSARSLPQVPVFTSRVDAVTLDVSVQEGKRPVAGLAAANFEVLDNGVRQHILDVSVETVPRDVALLLDQSESLGSVRANIPDRVRHIPREIGVAIRPGDQLQVVLFASAIRRINGLDVSPLDLPLERRQTALFDAVLLAAMQRAQPGRRRIIIVVTDGIDTISATDYRIRAAVLDRTDVVIHIVAITQFRGAARFAPLGESGGSFERFRWILADMTDRTGGRFFDLSPEADLLPAVKAAIDESLTRYVLRFEASSAVRGWHALTVSVPAKNYDVRSRRGYWRE